MTVRTDVAPTARKPWPWWLTSFGVQVTAGLVLGVVVGFVAAAMGTQADGSANGLTRTLDTIGHAYVDLLKAAVIPLISTAIISSIANLRRVSNAARLAAQTLLWFAITALIAVSIGIALGVTLKPGLHVGDATLVAQAPAVVGSWWDFLIGLIPHNYLGLALSADTGAAGQTTYALGFNVLQVIVVAAALGIAALKVGGKAEPFLAFNESVLAIVQKVLWWIIRLAPIGTLALIGHAVAAYGTPTLASLAWFIGAVYLGLAIVLFGVYPVLVKSHGLSVKKYFSGVWPAVQLGFVSRSSIGTLPLTQQVTERNLGVPRAYAAFAVPLGATTKMDGCAAIYPALAAIFVAQFYGIDLTILQYALIVLVSVVGSAATAGMTGAVIMLTLTLSTLGLPLEGVGLLLAVDPVLDMARTALNVAGQALVPTVVAKREGILDHALYNAERRGVPFGDEAGRIPDTQAVADADAVVSRKAA
ncbi:MAG TPA: dicarboxylate/amino acid:cation symporter [Oleiagrimonas sp.]|nr:dicarboxylate/amino acid:cation symporter [Oleiagrimonas sp.]